MYVLLVASCREWYYDLILIWKIVLCATQGMVI